MILLYRRNKITIL